MQLIGLTGQAGAGKDTVADILVDYFNFTKMAWADPLYEEVSAAYGGPERMSVEHLKMRETKELPQFALSRASLDTGFGGDHEFERVLESAGYGRLDPVSPRHVLQLWGTEYRRAQDCDYWVNQTRERIAAWKIRMRHEMADAIRDDDQNYQEPGGIVIVGTRFWFGNAPSGGNEETVVRENGGRMWHVWRTMEGGKPKSDHPSDLPLPIRTGDKLILNFGDIETLATAVQLALSGNDIVNTESE